MNPVVGAVNATDNPGGFGITSWSLAANSSGGFAILSPAFLGTVAVLYAVVCSSLRFRSEKRMRREL